MKIFTFSKTKENVSDFFAGFLVGGWNYVRKAREDFDLVLSKRKQRRYERKALKDYYNISPIEYMGDKPGDCLTSIEGKKCHHFPY